MATKKVKKVAKGTKKSSSSIMSMISLRAIVALMVALLALSMLLIFVNNQATIMSSGNFNVFITLVAVGLALLLGLLYLINPQKK